MSKILKQVNGDARLEFTVRVFLGAVFVYAGMHKILAPAHFAKVIYGYGLFPGAMINLTAIVLPFVELYAGIFLIAGIYPRAAALVICGMLMVFITAITINLIRGHEFDCGCFSFGEKESGMAVVELLIRDIVLFSAGSYVLCFQAGRRACLLESGGS